VTLAVIFPGQGTQEAGMGLPWREHEAWRVVEQAEAALGEPLGDLIISAPAEQLTRTRDAQLAVLLMSLVAWRAVEESGAVTEPVAFAGHSLGQVTALIAAGVLGIEEGVRFAARRAEVTQRAADSRPGRMAALLGASLSQAEDACAAGGACWIANDNAPGQVVVAGTPEGVEAGIARAKELGVKRATPLKVGGAFHTPLMREAADALAREVLPPVRFGAPSAPVVSNHDARAYDGADGWRPRLAEHVVGPVRWRPSMETLAGLGATGCLEVGHGSMLAALAKRTVPDVAVRGVATPDDLPSLSEVH
jgi:[acyl-carrier-protein] S-malonyltransferase